MENAILVSVVIHGWQATKQDKRISREVADTHFASQNAGRYNKRLLPKEEAGKEQQETPYDVVLKKGRELRAFVTQNTLAWRDGERVLPTANYEQFTAGARKLIGDYERAADHFVVAYPDMKANAAKMLNGMYRESDYPNAQVIRTLFSVDLETAPVPKTGDFPVVLTPSEIERLREEMAERERARLTAANKELWGRLHKVVELLATRLATPSARLYGSLLENLRAEVEVIPRLNVTQDQNLEPMVRVVAALGNHDIEALRSDEALRASVAAQAQQIADKMAAFMA
jgi:hypothetical protein